MENWRKFRDSDELVVEGFLSNRLRISPNFKTQGKFSRFKNKFTKKKGDRSVDPETGKDKLLAGHEDHMFQFHVAYKTPGEPNGRVWPLGEPVDFTVASPSYRGTISSPEDIKKLWEHILDHNGPVYYRMGKMAEEMDKKWGPGKWQLLYGYVDPNGLVDKTVFYVHKDLYASDIEKDLGIKKG